MVDVKYDVFGIGNVLFDVLVKIDEVFLVKYGMVKGSMFLIDEVCVVVIYKDMGLVMEVLGGLVVNIIVGIGSFGVCVVYVGKVKDD